MSEATSGGTVHATALVVPTPHGPQGLLVTGASGSGKSALALGLLEHFVGHGRFAMLVADDRVILERLGDILVARAPPPLAGLIERRGVGLLRRPHLTAARMHIHVALAAESERMPEAAERSFEGVVLPSLTVSGLNQPHARDSGAIVRAWLQERT